MTGHNQSDALRIIFRGGLLEVFEDIVKWLRENPSVWIFDVNFEEGEGEWYLTAYYSD